MGFNLTVAVSTVSLVLAVFIFGVSVTQLGTPVTDVGMASTVLMFLLFGVLGLLLDRAQKQEAQTA